MPITFQARVGTVGNSLMIIISKDLARNYNLKRGDDVDIVCEDDGLFIPVAIVKKPRNKGVKH